MSFIDPSIIKPFNVVLDAGSGMGGLVAPKLFERLPCRTTRLCFEIDGTLPEPRGQPAHRREPPRHRRAGDRREGRHRHRLGRRRRSLLLHRRHRRVHRRRLRHGAARRGVPAEASRARRSSTTCAPATRSRTSSRKYGGTALMNRVGHAFFKRRMRETNAIFGGEVTGHYYFRDNFYADNGFIPALLILELMSKKGQTPARAARAAAREVLHLRRDQHQARRHGRRCRRSSTALAAKYTRRPRRTRWTASRSSIPTGTSTCAPSNTEPLLRLNLEATTQEMMEAEARRSAGVHPGLSDWALAGLSQCRRPAW